MKTVFIYALCEPGTRTVRYIGKANDPESRLRGHLVLAKKRSNHRECWLFSVLSQGLKPELVVLREVPTSDWKMAEERYIRLARGCGMKLTNGTDGGDGSLEHSPETKKKIAEKCARGVRHYLFGKTGKDTPSFGLIRSPEARAKMSAAQSGEKSHVFGKTGENSHNFGRVQSPETRAKRSAALSGENNPMFGKNGAASPNFGKPRSLETRARISATKKAASALRKLHDQEIEWALAPYILE